MTSILNTLAHRRSLLTAALFVLFSFAAELALAQNTKNEGMTHGLVQMTMTVGETTQLEVLEAFGAPNITTIDATGQEVWTYHKHATVSQSKTKSKSFGILFGGAGGALGGVLGGGASSTNSGFEQSTRSMILIIKFNKQNVVSDFRSRSSSF